MDMISFKKSEIILGGKHVRWCDMFLVLGRVRKNRNVKLERMLNTQKRRLPRLASCPVEKGLRGYHIYSLFFHLF